MANEKIVELAMLHAQGIIACLEFIRKDMADDDVRLKGINNMRRDAMALHACLSGSTPAIQDKLFELYS